MSARLSAHRARPLMGDVPLGSQDQSPNPNPKPRLWRLEPPDTFHTAIKHCSNDLLPRLSGEKENNPPNLGSRAPVPCPGSFGDAIPVCGRERGESLRAQQRH